MKSEKLEVARGSGNVFNDLENENADVQQFKAILAAEIIKALDRDGLSVRAAQRRTKIAAADFSRIRNADLARFTVDRLMSIINRLGSRVEVNVKVRPVDMAAQERPRRTDLTDVVRHQSLNVARAVIRETESLGLSERDSLRILAMMENPPKPKAKLLSAARSLTKRK